MRYLLSLACCLLTLTITAQSELVKVKSNGSTIMVKWFPEELINTDGFDIYRAEQGSSDFTKLNSNPIKIDLNQRINNDAVSNRYVEIAKKYVEDPEIPMAKFYLLMRAMTSDEFAKYIGIRYDDNNVESGKTYVYQVRRLGGRSTNLGTSEAISLGDRNEILPPKNAQLVFQSSTRNTFKWEPETDRYFGVNVYRKSTSSEWTKINNTPVIPVEVPDEFGIVRYPDYFFEDSTISKITYEYAFTALDPFGDESERSTPLIVQSIDRKPPTPTSRPELNGSLGSGVELKWNRSRSSDLAGYNILRSMNGDTLYYKRNTALITETSFVDDISDPGTYFYFIEAVDEAGNSTLSEMSYIIISDLTPPADPSNLEVSVEPGRAMISWTGKASSDFWGYKVLRSDLVNPRKSDFQPIIPEPILETSYTDVFAGESELALYYAVVALDTFNNESAWLISDLVTTPDTVAPSAPVIINVEAAEQSVTIEWIKSPNIDVEGYKVMRCKKNDMDWKPLDSEWITAEMTTYVDENPIPGELLCYKIVARDDAGNISNASNPYTIKTKNNSTGGRQAIDLSETKYRKSKKLIQLEWSKINNQEISGYMVFRSENEGKMTPASPFIKEPQFEDKKIHNNTNYTYQVKAFSPDGQVLISNLKSISIK